MVLTCLSCIIVISVLVLEKRLEQNFAWQNTDDVICWYIRPIEVFHDSAIDDFMLSFSFVCFLFLRIIDDKNGLKNALLAAMHNT